MKKQRRLMGTVKISEEKITIKKNGIVEVYVRTFNLSSNTWVVYNGYTYELESSDEEVF
jgi:hypothetical protein